MFRKTYSFLGNGREEKCAAKCIKIPKNGRFRNINFQKFPGEHALGPPKQAHPSGEEVAFGHLTSVRKFQRSVRKLKQA